MLASLLQAVGNSVMDTAPHAVHVKPSLTFWVLPGPWGKQPCKPRATMGGS